MIKWYKEIKRRKANGETMRPFWQMPLAALVYIPYILAQKYVDWVDDTF